MNRPIADRRSLPHVLALCLVAATTLACGAFRLPVLSELMANAGIATSLPQGLVPAAVAVTGTVAAATAAVPSPLSTATPALESLSPEAGGVIPGPCLSQGAGCPAAGPANPAARHSPATADHAVGAAQG